ncbi:MAG: PilZ domain-containing protein [Planctomycetes bacterium]|nr:PilZ domain-containing protein [Planctomycetota bacterium]
MPLEPERRDFVRVSADIIVRYRFQLISGATRKATEQVLTGATANLSGGGLLLRGPLPDIAIVTELVTGKATLEVELTLPSDPRPILAKARCAWVETVDEATMKCHLGLRFTQIAAEEKERIFRYVIRVQMPV